MLIDERNLKHWIENFFGYGSWNAKFWFIAHEERGGDTPQEVAGKINYYQASKSKELANIREVYRHTPVRAKDSERADNMHDLLFGAKAKEIIVWKNITEFIIGYTGKDKNTLKYQKEKFASDKGEEALMSLYPLPGPSNHGWYYNWLDLKDMPYLESREQYEDYLYERRINFILQKIKTHRPEIVLMYGMHDINVLKASIQDFFRSDSFKSVKAIPRKIPQHHILRIEKTTILLTTQIPALRHHRVETGFDWREFGESLMVNR